jgi:hypothetical protein
MPRPEFPRCIMPVSVIQRIRSEQDYYDQNPERYEAEQRRREEDRRLEQEQERQEYERQFNDR